MGKLVLCRVELADANAFVARLHRHHRPVVGHKFSLGCTLAGTLVGVVIVGRPVARMRDDGETLEATRLCTDGTPNACSFLYGAASRATFALGYRRIGTYILASEPGTSLRAAGWRLIGETSGGSWSRPGRLRDDKHPLESKLLFEAAACPAHPHTPTGTPLIELKPEYAALARQRIDSDRRAPVRGASKVTRTRVPCASAEVPTFHHS